MPSSRLERTLGTSRAPCFPTSASSCSRSCTRQDPKRRRSTALFRLADHTGMARFQPRGLCIQCRACHGLTVHRATMPASTRLAPCHLLWVGPKQGWKTGVGDRLVTQSIAIASVRCRHRSSPRLGLTSGLPRDNACMPAPSHPRPLGTQGWDRRRKASHAKPPVENRTFVPVATDGLSRVPLPEHQRGLTVFTSLACSPHGPALALCLGCHMAR